jgi:hypothetical protein
MSKRWFLVNDGNPIEREGKCKLESCLESQDLQIYVLRNICCYKMAIFYFFSGEM